MTLVKLMAHGAAGTIVLNRPDKRNALNRELLNELDAALRTFHREKSVRAIVITGAGTAFCAGMDLAEMHETSSANDSLARWAEDAELYRDLLEYMLRFPKPIIAAVNGAAVAGGLGLLLASDLVISAPESKLGLPEPLRGIVAGMVSPLLAFRIGAGQAAPLLLTGRIIDGTTAHRIGLVHELVSHEQLWARSLQIAAEIARCAPEALLMTKRMLNETIGEHLSTLLTAGAAVSATARTTASATEGLQAFLEKREPKW